MRKIIYRVLVTAALIVFGIILFFGSNAVYFTAPTDFFAPFFILVYFVFSFLCFGFAIWMNFENVIRKGIMKIKEGIKEGLSQYQEFIRNLVKKVGAR